MVISSPADLIPYDKGKYPMLPQRPEDVPAISKDIVEHHCRLQQPPTTKIIAAGSERFYGNRYTSNRCWQYDDNYQIGERIDIYA